MHILCLNKLYIGSMITSFNLKKNPATCILPLNEYYCLVNKKMNKIWFPKDAPRCPFRGFRREVHPVQSCLRPIRHSFSKPCMVSKKFRAHFGISKVGHHLHELENAIQWPSFILETPLNTSEMRKLDRSKGILPKSVKAWPLGLNEKFRLED